MEGVPVYRKADSKSEVLSTTPPGMTRIMTNYQVPGLDGNGPYWQVYHVEKDYWIHGYIHNDNVK